MRKTVWTWLFAAVICGFMVSPAQAQTKIGVVDLRKLFDNYYKTKLAGANLNEDAMLKEKEQKELLESFKKMDDERKILLEKANDQVLSSTEREKNKVAAEKKLNELKILEETINQFNVTAKTQLTQKKGRVREQIVKEIQEVVTAKAKAGNFTLVLDSVSETVNGTPVILYNNGENDLTDAILTQLNLNAPASLPETKISTEKVK